MKKKAIKGRIICASAITAAVATVLIGAIIISGLILGSLFGNPISKSLAKRTAEKRLATEYSDTDYSLSDVRFSYKECCYHAHIVSKSSPDSSFTLSIGKNGRLIYDDYAARVTGRGNTARRIDTEYRAAVEKIIDSDTFPYEVEIGYGTLLFDRDTSLADFPVGTLDINELVLDKTYDTRELGKAAGEITLYINGEDITHERLTEILLDIKRIFIEGEVCFNSINLILESNSTERVEVMSMLYEDIYEDGLLERVISSDAAAKEYYKKMDEEKLNGK